MSNVNEPVFTEIVNRLNEMNERVFGKGEAFTLEDRALLKRVTQQVQGTIDGLADPKPMTAKPDVWERLALWTHSQEDEEAAIARGRALERVAEAARPITHRSPELHAAIVALDAAGTAEM